MVHHTVGLSPDPPLPPPPPLSVRKTAFMSCQLVNGTSPRRSPGYNNTQTRTKQLLQLSATEHECANLVDVISIMPAVSELQGSRRWKI